MYNTKFNWNNYINSCIESYLCPKICIGVYILGDSDKYNDIDFNSYICGLAQDRQDLV